LDSIRDLKSAARETLLFCRKSGAIEITQLAYSRVRSATITASAADRDRLEKWVRASTTPQRVVRRSRIVLLWLDGMRATDISTRVGVSRPTVHLWVRRFASAGPEALLHDAPGRGRPPAFDAFDLRTRLAEAHLLDESGQIVDLERAAQLLHVSTSTIWRTMRRKSLR
jgi:transposase